MKNEVDYDEFVECLQLKKYQTVLKKWNDEGLSESISNNFYKVAKRNEIQFSQLFEAILFYAEKIYICDNCPNYTVYQNALSLIGSIWFCKTITSCLHVIRKNMLGGKSESEIEFNIKQAKRIISEKGLLYAKSALLGIYPVNQILFGNYKQQSEVMLSRLLDEQEPNVAIINFIERMATDTNTYDTLRTMFIGAVSKAPRKWLGLTLENDKGLKIVWTVIGIIWGNKENFEIWLENINGIDDFKLQYRILRQSDLAFVSKESLDGYLINEILFVPLDEKNNYNPFLS